MRINKIILLVLFLSILTVFAVCVISIYDSQQKVKSNQVRIDSLNHAITFVKVDYGKAIYLRDCRMCHAMKGSLHDYLEGVVDSVGEHYFKLYLTKQDSLILAGDKYATLLKQQWGNQGNSHNFKYSISELEAIIQYRK